QRWYIPAADHYDIGVAAFIVARPFPYAQSLRAMGDGRIHVQPLQCGLFTSHDDVDAVAVAQAMIGDREQRIRIRRQIDANDGRLLVDDEIEETGVLMAESVVVLPPHV